MNRDRLLFVSSNAKAMEVLSWPKPGLKRASPLRLLWLEAALGHLVELEGVMVLHLLANGVLAHLPLELGNAATNAPAHRGHDIQECEGHDIQEDQETNQHHCSRGC